MPALSLSPWYLALQGTSCDKAASHGGAVSESIQVQLKKGVLELCVLALLSRGDSYAYEIASRMAEDIGMGEGTVYPLMRRIQSDGLVRTYLRESANGPPRKYYQLTPAGYAALESQRTEWDSFERAVRKIVGGAHEPQHVSVASSRRVERTAAAGRR
jgi:PadR family transcriptional regulator PadR